MRLAKFYRLHESDIWINVDKIEALDEGPIQFDNTGEEFETTIVIAEGKNYIVIGNPDQIAEEITECTVISLT